MGYGEFINMLFVIYDAMLVSAIVYFALILNPKRYRVVTVSMGVQSLREAKALHRVEVQIQ
jgi:hypothetical protein